MSLRETLRKAAGLIVELPAENAEIDGLQEELVSDEPMVTQRPDIGQMLAAQGLGPKVTETKTVEEIVQQAEGPNLDEIAGEVEKSTIDPAAHEIDCGAIYTAAKLPPVPFTAEQMLDMLAQLPPELPLATRRQTVQVTMNAIGKTVGAMPETIVADASRKIAALAAYNEHLNKRTVEFTERTSAEIDALQLQIEEKRKSIQEARARLISTEAMCIAESGRLDDVLEFFGLDEGASKYAPSKPNEEKVADTPPNSEG